MINQRMISRSIILDPVNDRIEQLRYTQHKKSLMKISHTHCSFFEKGFNSEYIHQIEKYKKSNSYVKNIFDSRTQDNKNLVKKMMDIDRRKSPFEKEEKKLPAISAKKRSKEQE